MRRRLACTTVPWRRAGSIPPWPIGGRLLLGAGAARAASGDMAGARQAFLGAAEHARRTGRAVQLANAALGLSGAGFEVALFDEEQSRLLEEALGALGDREPALR